MTTESYVWTRSGSQILAECLNTLPFSGDDHEERPPPPPVLHLVRGQNWGKVWGLKLGDLQDEQNPELQPCYLSCLLEVDLLWGLRGGEGRGRGLGGRMTSVSVVQ